MQYAELIAAVIGVLALAGLADQMTGKRGFFATFGWHSTRMCCSAIAFAVVSPTQAKRNRPSERMSSNMR